jgi:hypothetical protein
MIARLAAIVGTLTVASGAAATAQQFVAGLAGGATYSDFSNPDTDSRWGFTGGLFVGKPTYRSLTLLEVNYTQKGGQSAGSDVRIDYVEVGVTGGGLAGRPGGSRARVYGGIQVAFPVTCEGLDVLCNNTNTEWGFPVGVLLGRWKDDGGFFGLDVRYTIPLSDAGLNIFNNSWMFRVSLGRPAGR